MKTKFVLNEAMTVAYSKTKHGYVFAIICLPKNMELINQENKEPYVYLGLNEWGRYIPEKVFDMTKERNLLRKSIFIK